MNIADLAVGDPVEVLLEDGILYVDGDGMGGWKGVKVKYVMNIIVKYLIPKHKYQICFIAVHNTDLKQIVPYTLLYCPVQ